MTFRRHAFAMEVADYLTLSVGKGQRYGQAVYNVMSEWHFEVANKLTNTKFDCFEDDSKAEKFIDECERLLGEKE